MAKVQHIDALKRIKMNFSTVGIRTPLKDYELAYWINVLYGMGLACRPEVIDEWDKGIVWEYNVFDGKDPNGEPLCMIMNLSIGAQKQEPSEWSLFESAPEKYLLPTVKHWDYLLIVENSDFAFDLESALKMNEKITTAQYFEAHTQLTRRETHLLYEIRNS
tara:strand:- start:117 stop:602 length:486 start_codon:yes stop_codon:yes gene_type:complete